MEAANNAPLKKYEQELTELYQKYVDEFIRMHRKYGEEDCFDAYGEAVLTIYESLKTGKTRKGNPFEITKDLKSLLFVSAKKKLITLLERRSNKRKLEDDYLRELALAIEETHTIDLRTIDSNPRIKEMITALHSMSNNCQKLLGLFYFEGYDLQEIEEIRKYNNKSVVTSSLSRCREKLKALLSND